MEIQKVRAATPNGTCMYLEADMDTNVDQHNFSQHVQGVNIFGEFQHEQKLKMFILSSQPSVN